ncbi:hypothetical protein OS493_011303 [Desmophyllum pertusum]|uniref:Uncharacterized protein n=1 Tax=Desmophyllum pertusum TaxID=174260 RepID=A0A9X0CU95_9CNID|nr:hypothetical protein OS493_011303 [Desmophyllum pertusum]
MTYGGLGREEKKEIWQAIGSGVARDSRGKTISDIKLGLSKMLADLLKRHGISCFYIPSQGDMQSILMQPHMLAGIIPKESVSQPGALGCALLYGRWNPFVLSVGGMMYGKDPKNNLDGELLRLAIHPCRAQDIY